METNEKRISTISIVVRDRTMSDRINDILSRHGDAIRGRLGIPCPDHGVSIIVIVLEAVNAEIGAISGAIGNIPGVTIRSTILL